MTPPSPTASLACTRIWVRPRVALSDSVHHVADACRVALDMGSEEKKARAFIELLSAGAEGAWAATERSKINRKPRWFGSGLDLAKTLVSEGWGVLDYFVPHPFERQKRKFDALVDPVQVVRVDLDPPAMPFDEQQTFVEAQLEEIRLLAGDPTAVVDSGRGRWVYLKLSESVSKERARRLNRALHAFAKSEDPRAYNPAQWARLPGSVNEKTERRAVVVEVEPTRLFDPVELELALREFLPKAKQTAITGLGRDFQWSADKLVGVVLPELPAFSSDLQEYIDLSPTTEESLARWGRTRHQMEMRVFIRLASSGWTNLDIHAFAYQQRLSRYREESEKRSPYGDLSVSKARSWVDEHPLPEKKLSTTHPLTIERELAPPPSDEAPDLSKKRLSHLKFWLLKEVDGSRPGVIYERMATKYAGRPGVKKRNLQGHMAFLIEEGLVYREKGEDGSDRLFRTERGDRLAARRFLPQVLSSYRMSAEGVAGRDRAIETRREHERLMRLPPRPRRTDSVSARQRRAARHRYRTNFDGRLRLSFDGRQSVFYLQLVTPSEEVQTVDLYPRIYVGTDEHGLPEWTSAISLSDPVFEGKEADDPARDRGLKRWTARVGLGAVLKKTSDGFALASVPNQDGELVPAVGLLVEDAKDFWDALWDAIPEPEERVVRVRRSGAWDDRSFDFEVVGEAIPLDGVPVPDLDEYLDEIQSPERLRELVAGQPEHSTLRYYPG